MRAEVVVGGASSGRVSIGVPTYNGSERVGWLLTTLRRVGLPSDAVLTLLDDGSPAAGEFERLHALAEQYGTRLLRHAQNHGITASWNDLVHDAQTEFCVLLNDDVFLTPGWLENLVYFLKNNDCGAASPNLLFCTREDVPRLLAGEPVTPRHPITKAHEPERMNQDPEEAPGVVMCALGSGFGFRRSVFNQLGGFDERTRQIYNESWLGTKAARDLKFPSYCIPAPRIWHLWSATFQQHPHLGRSSDADRAAYMQEFGGNFDVTHPKFMHGTMPPRVVKWIGPDGQPRERELTVQ